MNRRHYHNDDRQKNRKCGTSNAAKPPLVNDFANDPADGGGTGSEYDESDWWNANAP